MRLSQEIVHEYKMGCHNKSEITLSKDMEGKEHIICNGDIINPDGINVVLLYPLGATTGVVKKKSAIYNGKKCKYTLYEEDNNKIIASGFEGVLRGHRIFMAD